MGVRTLSEYLLTYLWVGMECVAAVLLFDAFSQRKKKTNCSLDYSGLFYFFGFYVSKSNESECGELLENSDFLSCLLFLS